MAFDAIKSGHHGERLADREQRFQPVHMAQIMHALWRWRQVYRARHGRQETGDDAQKRGFAAAIGAIKGKRRARFQLERNAVENRTRPIATGQAGDAHIRRRRKDFGSLQM